MQIKLSAINLSEKKGTVKTPVESARITELGLEGDAHAGHWHRQISLLGRSSIDRFNVKAGRAIAPGEFAENLILDGIDLRQVAVLDRFRIGSVQLEVTQIGKTCHGDGCAIFRAVGECVMPREGLFARVITPGDVVVGDAAQYEPRPLRIQIVTLSDRAYDGVYEDRSGPHIRSMLEAFFEDRRWHPAIEQMIIPDDGDRLSALLKTAAETGVDAVITTGGTGIGPRDITPEVVSAVADRLIPGIMEQIRLKYGMEKPNALLSRSVAAVKNRTLIYALPGSVKAVTEYMTEILKTLEHALAMLHGLGH